MKGKQRFSGMAILAIIIGSWLAPQSTSASLIKINDPSLVHFSNFYNEPPAGDFSRMSLDEATTYGDFGWHSHASYSSFPLIAGILLGNEQYAVSELGFQVHANPIKNFTLQGSTDTTNGLDGNWSDVFSSEVTERGDLGWQRWTFDNTTKYSAYRILIEDDYTAFANGYGGFAMYRWELLAESSPVPIPGAVWLFGSGLVGLIGLKRKYLG